MSWLEAWSRDGKAPADALQVFDDLPAVLPSEIIGEWRGSELPTGHALDGLLKLYGWWGKRFTDPETVDPLLFEHGGRVVAIDPDMLPLRVPLAFPRLARTNGAAGLLRLILPLLITTRPKARLRTIDCRGRASAAMIYDDQPIIDHFRRVDQDRLLGLMDLRLTSQPFFFQLTRSAV